MKTKQTIASQTVFTMLAISTVSLTLLAACGGSNNGITDRQQNPTKNYDLQLVARHQVDTSPKSKMTQLFSLDVTSGTTLVQGQPGVITINPNLFFAHNESVRYNLELADAQGTDAKIEKVDGNNWQIRWTPPSTTLSSDDSNKQVNFEVQFGLTADSSAESKSEFAGQYANKTIPVTVIKSYEQPSIDESTVKYTPAKVLNSDQDTTVQFVVHAKGLMNIEQLQVDIVNGPSKIVNGQPQIKSNELPQLDGSYGVTSYPTRIQTLGGDKYLYQLTFSARKFIDVLTPALETNPVWKTKFEKGTIDVPGEALFYLKATNTYNNQTSAPQQVLIQVNLHDKAGEPRLVFGDAHHPLKAGQVGAYEYIIDSHGTQSHLAMDSVDFAGENVAFKNGHAEIVQDKMKVSITCKQTAGQLTTKTSCQSGQCVEICEAVAEADCGMKAGSQVVGLNSTSTLADTSTTAKINFSIDVKDNPACAAKTVTTAATPAPKSTAKGAL